MISGFIYFTSRNLSIGGPIGLRASLDALTKNKMAATRLSFNSQCSTQHCCAVSWLLCCVVLLSTGKHSNVSLKLCQVENNNVRRFVGDLGTLKVVSTGSFSVTCLYLSTYCSIVGRGDLRKNKSRMNRIKDRITNQR